LTLTIIVTSANEAITIPVRRSTFLIYILSYNNSLYNTIKNYIFKGRRHQLMQYNIRLGNNFTKEGVRR
jgi:DNA-directed RNA polymerase subunit L